MWQAYLALLEYQEIHETLIYKQSVSSLRSECNLYCICIRIISFSSSLNFTEYTVSVRISPT